EQSVGASHRCPAVAKDVPGEADSWCKVILVGVVEAPREVSREQHAHWCCGEYCRVHGRVWVDRVDTVKLVLPWNRQFVAQTQNQRKPRSIFPLVLRIDRVESAVAIVVAHTLGGRALLVGSQKGVRHRIAIGCGPATGTPPVK